MFRDRALVASAYLAYSHTLLSARNFVAPNEFLPERWLEGGIGGPHNIEAYVPFCYGPGVCIGKPVALYNMKYALSDDRN